MMFSKQGGFTIIELMLFLGITGALFAALMIGANVSIVQQRYKDNVSNITTFFENQYSEVLNTQNDRDSAWSCNSEGQVAPASIDGTPRGTSGCVILGRAVEVSNKGSLIKTSGVVGVQPTSEGVTSDIATLVSYRPKLADLNPSENDLGSEITMEVSKGVPTTMSFLVLRSPATGTIRVFASSEPLPADLSTMINVANASNVRTACIMGTTGSLPTNAVSIDPRVAGPSGVILNENARDICG